VYMGYHRCVAGSIATPSRISFLFHSGSYFVLITYHFKLVLPTAILCL
jgi:hypothetical protein